MVAWFTAYWRAILALFLAFLVICGVVVGFWFFLHHKDPGPTPVPVPAEISLPSTLQVQPGMPATLAITTSGSVIKTISDPGVVLLPGPNPKVWYVFGGTAGTYQVWAYTAINGLPSDPAACIVTVGTPGPPAPIPPGPGPVPPDPNPPTPPTPPAPITVKGLHVLIVVDNASLSKLPAAQLQVLYSKQVRDFLNANCVVGPDGKTKEWRLWDAKADASNESQLWQDAFKRQRTVVPWVVISNGTAGFEGPLPATVTDMMALLQKYASTGRKGPFSSYKLPGLWKSYALVMGGTRP